MNVTVEESKVEVVVLDDFIREHVAGEAIPLVKMDVEGHEQAVKDGLIESLRGGRVDVVYWERQGAHVERLERMRDEVDFMARLGYMVYVIACPHIRKKGQEGRRGKCRLCVLRIDAEFWSDEYEPGLYKAPRPDGRDGKPSAINLIGVRADHPFNALTPKKLLVPLEGTTVLNPPWNFHPKINTK